MPAYLQGALHYTSGYAEPERWIRERNIGGEFRSAASNGSFRRIRVVVAIKAAAAMRGSCSFPPRTSTFEASGIHPGEIEGMHTRAGTRTAGHEEALERVGASLPMMDRRAA